MRGLVYKPKLKVTTMKKFLTGLILAGLIATAGCSGCSQNATPPAPADPNGHMPGGAGHGPGGPEHRPGNQDGRRDR
jgi:hypothetical protein